MGAGLVEVNEALKLIRSPLFCMEIASFRGIAVLAGVAVVLLPIVSYNGDAEESAGFCVRDCRLPLLIS